MDGIGRYDGWLSEFGHSSLIARAGGVYNYIIETRGGKVNIWQLINIGLQC